MIQDMLTALKKLSQEQVLTNHDCIAIFISANGQKGKIRDCNLMMCMAYRLRVRAKMSHAYTHAGIINPFFNRYNIRCGKRASIPSRNLWHLSSKKVPAFSRKTEVVLPANLSWKYVIAIILADLQPLALVVVLKNGVSYNTVIVVRSTMYFNGIIFPPNN